MDQQEQQQREEEEEEEEQEEQEINHTMGFGTRISNGNTKKNLSRVTSSSATELSDLLWRIFILLYSIARTLVARRNP